ncbi:MAG TPA: hypothetical protein VFB34_13495 [Chloroflexota bacterium]|nr:hypothetical protein [Chloroflexota bacterium]
MHVQRRMIASALALLALVAFGAAGLTHTASAATNSRIQVVNISDQSFGVAWFSTGKVASSSIEYGTSCATASAKASEMPSDGFAHLAVTSGGLAANTTYYFKIVSGSSVDSNGGKCYQARTFPAESLPPPPNGIYGTVRTAGCKSTAPGSLIIVTVQHKTKTGITTSSTMATMSSTFSKMSGNWALPFAEATRVTGAFFSPAKGDTITFAAASDATHRSSGTVVYDGSSTLTGPVKVCV